MLLNALKVLTLTPATRAFLTANDPRALAQAEAAIAAVEAAQANLAAFIDKWSHAGMDKPEERIGYVTKLRDLQAAAGITPEVLAATRTLHGVEYRMFRRGRDYRMTGGTSDHTLTDSGEERAQAHWNGYSLGHRPQAPQAPAQAPAPERDTCSFCGEPYAAHRPASGNAAPFCMARDSRPGDRFVAGSSR